MSRKKSPFNDLSAPELAIVHDPSAANCEGYIMISKDNGRILMHRWIWEQLVGPVPQGHQIDHINGIRTDNRLSNLRCISQKMNLRNSAKRKNRTSGISGVSRIFTSQWYWVATWSDPVTGKCKLKYFSIKKLGEEAAQQAATEFRLKIIEDLRTNHGYSDRHGE